MSQDIGIARTHNYGSGFFFGAGSDSSGVHPLLQRPRDISGAIRSPRAIPVVGVVMSPQSAAADRFADIVIITGLTKELEWFSKTIGVQFTRIARQGTSYLRGIHRVGDREISIVAVRQLDKGLTSAAVTTTKAICLWQPSVVVMTGICAGVEQSVALGDLVVATQCFEHSSGQLVDGEIVPLQNRISLEPWFLDYLMSISDSPACATTVQGGYPGPLAKDFAMRIHYGPMAGGPLWSPDRYTKTDLPSPHTPLLALSL